MAPDLHLAERSARRARGRRRTPLAAAIAVAVATTVLAGCGSSAPPDPATARQDRVEHRLRTSFSARQADCILEGLDTATIKGLDRRGPLAAGSPELLRYTAAVETCLESSAATTTPTSTAPPTTRPGG